MISDKITDRQVLIAKGEIDMGKEIQFLGAVVKLQSELMYEFVP